MNLADEHPQEYPRGTPSLSSDEIDPLKEKVTGWRIEDEKLVRTFEFKDFKEAFAFIARVALLVEEEGHHPDIFNSWNQVKLSFWTHTAEGLTRNDFIMAAKIDTFAPR